MNEIKGRTAEYWSDLDSRLALLAKTGWVKLPSVAEFDLSRVADGISNEMGNRTFMELGACHASFLESMRVDQVLAPRLFNLARGLFGYKGALSDQYHIARRVEPGNSEEMYRAHFDSHLFTMVVPIRIPESTQGETVGELVFFPHARAIPANEITNLVSKGYHKRFASKAGIDKFSERHKPIIEDFKDYCPLVFLGNTTLHTNRSVSQFCSSYRLTLLAHFFDPGPRFGVGSLMRMIRKR